jgi:hypothetical protein
VRETLLEMSFELAHAVVSAGFGRQPARAVRQFRGGFATRPLQAAQCTRGHN